MIVCDSFYFFKQKTAYEMRISDWSSDVCSSDLRDEGRDVEGAHADQRDVRLIGGEHQRAALGIEEVDRRLDADACEQRQRFVEDAPLGDGKDDRFGHKRRAFKRRWEKGQ